MEDKSNTNLLTPQKKNFYLYGRYKNKQSFLEKSLSGQLDGGIVLCYYQPETPFLYEVKVDFSSKGGAAWRTKNHYSF